MRSLTFAFLVLLAAPVAAQEKGRSPENLAKLVAPFVDDLTMLVAHVDVERLQFDPFFKLFADVGIKDDDLDKVQALIAMARESFLKGGGRDLLLVWNWDAIRPQEDFLLIIPGKGAEGVAELLDKLPGMKRQMHGDVTLVSTARHLERLKSIKPVERPEIAQAFAALAKDAGKGILLPAPILVRGLVESFPKLPPNLGKTPTRDLARSLRWAGVGLRVEPKMEATLRLQASDEKGAQLWLDLIKNALDIPLDHPEVQLMFPLYAKMREKLVPKVVKDQLVLQLEEEFIKGMVVEAGKQAKKGASRAASANNLRQLALAFHSYHDAEKGLPPAFSADAKGKPLLSWRVHLLPYVEQLDLYKQFKLDEPWDSEHNKKLIDKMPAIFRSPLGGELPKGKTTYVVPTGAKTIFDGDKGLHLAKIPDGSSNTILILEATPKKAVFWTQPADFPIDQKDLLAGLVHVDSKGFHAAFADGSVRWIAGAVEPKMLRAALLIDDGTPLNLDSK